MFIRSQRLFLRPSWPEDQEELHAQFNDEPIVRSLASAPWPYRPADARAFAAPDQSKRWPWFVVTLPDARNAPILGAIGLSDEGTAAGLDYWIGPAYRDRGFATEAVRALVPLAAVLGHRRLVAHVLRHDPASARVLEKAGFRPTGEVLRRDGGRRGGAVLIHGFALDLDKTGDHRGGGEGDDPDRIAA